MRLRQSPAEREGLDGVWVHAFLFLYFAHDRDWRGLIYMARHKFIEEVEDE